MKRFITVFALALSLSLAATTPALAATSSSYSIVVPRFGADKYTSAKNVSAWKDFGVRHKYSGGKTIYFTVCNSSRQAIGPRVGIAPGGSTAPLTDLWYNNSASAKTVLVRMETSRLTPVDALAQGTWVWNY